MQESVPFDQFCEEFEIRRHKIEILYRQLNYQTGAICKWEKLNYGLGKFKVNAKPEQAESFLYPDPFVANCLKLIRYDITD